MQQIPNLDFMLGDTLNLPDAAAAAGTMVRLHRAIVRFLPLLTNCYVLAER
jgi:hypothetical protein